MDLEDTPQIITHIESNLNHCLFDCKWIPCSAKFVVIGSMPKGTGTLEIFEISSGEAKKIKEIERPNSFKCGTFGASSDVERKLATGDFKGTLEIWDLEKSCQVYITKEHTDIINSIDGMGGNIVNCGAPEIVTGSRDGTVKVWDPRQRGKPVANMQPAKGETKRDCWTVAFGNSFNDSERIVCAGYDNGDLKMFDLRTMSLRWECNLKNGVCYAEFDRKDIPMNKLVATTLEGKFHVFDVRTQNPAKGFAQKADIAKQFDLPERQSKITTLLNQAGQAYCICRSSDSSRFMIACDACEEWYHGDCINISEREAKYIKNYFCDRCREEDPTLKTKFRPQKREVDGDSASGRDDRKKKRKEKDHSENKSSKRPSPKDGCGDCPGCLQLADCGHCDACEDMDKYGGSNKLKLKCKKRLCVKSSRKPSKQSSSNRSKKKHHERESGEMEESIAHLQTMAARQCYGPQCARAAQFGSKYCSTQCGVRLATARIYQVLPQRIQEWSLSSCVAEQTNRKALEKVRSGLVKAQAALRALDNQHAELDALLARAKNATIEPTDEKEADDETSMYCVTCGHEIHSRSAVKHMEKCFIKYESQASFGSRHRTRIEGQSMFCDYYNPANGTYCKRLRVMCPEHFKDPKVSDTDVCGCPLVRRVFEPTGDFCRAPKKSCLKHYQWEKLRRAEIDMERVRQWLRLDELVEQERSIRLAMASRAGVLGLMLHSTYNHEVMERIAANKANENGKLKEGS